MIFKSLFTNYSAVKAYYGAKFNRALVKETPEGNKKAFTNYIKKNLAKFNLIPKKVFFYDHHLCHAVPSYYLSPFNEEKALALTLMAKVMVILVNYFILMDWMITSC